MRYNLNTSKREREREPLAGSGVICVYVIFLLDVDVEPPVTMAKK
jgi:hypothetical protein